MEMRPKLITSLNKKQKSKKKEGPSPPKQYHEIKIVKQTTLVYSDKEKKPSNDGMAHKTTS